MGKRIIQVNKLIREELSQIILKEAEFPSGTLVTLTRVETSVNLSRSRIYISCLPSSMAKRVFQILNRQIYELQQKLNQRLRMRPVPRIVFIEERETAKAGQIEKLLEEVKRGRD
ncbi:MAG: 30S ribosome-binding factor RbfA [bacterium]